MNVVLPTGAACSGRPASAPKRARRWTDLMTAVHALPAWRDLLKTRGWDDAFLVGRVRGVPRPRHRTETEAVLRDLGLAA